MHQQTQTTKRSPAGSTACLQHTIGLIYEAAMEPELWPETIQSMVSFVGNSGTHLLLMDESDRSVVETVHFNMPDELMAEYNGDKVKTCPRVANALSRPMNEFLFDYQHITEREIDHNEYYDWLQNIGDNIRYYLAIRFPAHDGLTCYQSLAFRAGEGHSEQTHAERFNLLLPHLKRSMELSQRLGGWRRIAESSLGLFDQLQCAAALLDNRGRMVASNQAFETLLTDSEWIGVKSRVPTFVQPALQHTFEGHVRQAAATSAGQARAAGGTMQIERGGRNFTVTISPLRDVTGTLSAGQSSVAVLITEPAAQTAPSPQELRERFGFTPAEARLAAELAAGHTLKQATARLNVSIHTTRTHLKALFAKTDTRRQADLVRKLLPTVLIKTDH